MNTLTTDEFVKMERRHKMYGCALFLMLVVQVVVFACQSTPQAQDPVQLGAVFAEGTCKGSLRMDLRVGFIALPVVADLDTHASPDGATGIVTLDLGGWLQARCDVFKGVADCKTSGILAPPRSMPVTANPNPASEGGPPDATK